MKMNMYVVENVLAGTHEGILLYTTDGYASDVLTRSIASRNGMDINDYRLWKLGTFDNQTRDICLLENPELVSWSSRRLKEVESESISSEDFNKDINSVK